MGKDFSFQYEMSRMFSSLSLLVSGALLSFPGSARQSTTVMVQLTGIQSFPRMIFFFPKSGVPYTIAVPWYACLVSSLHPKTPLNLMHQEGSCNCHLFSSTCLGTHVCLLGLAGSYPALPVSSSCLQGSSPHTGTWRLECSLMTESGA